MKLKANGKGEHWITFVSKALTHISEHARLDSPEAVKQFIANKNGSTGYKKNLCKRTLSKATYNDWEISLCGERG